MSDSIIIPKYNVGERFLCDKHEGQYFTITRLVVNAQCSTIRYTLSNSNTRTKFRITCDEQDFSNLFAQKPDAAIATPSSHPQDPQATAQRGSRGDVGNHSVARAVQKVEPVVGSLVNHAPVGRCIRESHINMLADPAAFMRAVSMLKAESDGRN
jgi:hypothetical protein